MAFTKPHIFKRLDESKPLPSEVTCVACSNKRDLLACGLANGEIQLNRAGCSWHKVWSLSSVGDNIVPMNLAFRPDSKVLAIGYSNGDLALCTLEKANVYHTHHLNQHITSLIWVEVLSGGCHTPNEFTYTDHQSTFLPKLAPSPAKATGFTDVGWGRREEQGDEAKGLRGQEGNLTLLLVGGDSGRVSLYGYGLLCFTEFELGLDLIIHHIQPQDDMSRLWILSICKATGVMSSRVLNTHSLQHHMHNLKIVSFQFGYCLYLKEYLEGTLHTMAEQWEDGLSLLERCLTHTAIEMRESSEDEDEPPSVCESLLSLLVVGEVPEAVYLMIQHQLSDKVVRKLAQQTDTSYTSLLKLVLRYLMLVSHALFYRIADIKALCSLPDGITNTGIILSKVEEAQRYLAGFMMKTAELQEVIESSQKVFKAFFKFLTTWSQKLSLEAPSQEAVKMTEEEIHLVSDLLLEQAEKEKQLTLEYLKKSNLSFDRVRQYLMKCDLSHPVHVKDQNWGNLHLQLLSHQSSQLFYPNYPSMSLIQLHRMFVNALLDIFLLPINNFASLSRDIVSNSASMTYMLSTTLPIRNKEATHPSDSHNTSGETIDVKLGGEGNNIEATANGLGDAGNNVVEKEKIDNVKGMIEKAKCGTLLIDSEKNNLSDVENNIGDDTDRFTTAPNCKINATAGVIARQCVWKDSIYRLLIEKARPTNGPSVGSSLLLIKQSLNDEANTVSALRIVVENDCNAQGLNYGFEDGDFFFYHQSIPQSLCLLVYRRGNVSPSLRPITPHLYMVPVSSLTALMVHILPASNCAHVISEMPMVPRTLLDDLPNTTSHRVDNMTASGIMVNSDRNVISVLHRARRKFCVFEFGELEMDTTDEIETDANITDTSGTENLEDI